jgi:hypothetical protein
MAGADISQLLARRDRPRWPSAMHCRGCSDSRCTRPVLAAIAASDALCCSLLGERLRGQDHRDAVSLLEQVRFGTGTDEVQGRRTRDLARALASQAESRLRESQPTHPERGESQTGTQRQHEPGGVRRWSCQVSVTSPEAALACGPQSAAGR